MGKDLTVLVLVLVLVLENIMSESCAPIEKRQTPSAKPVLSSPPMFDHEKLDVYHLELQFIAWLAALF